MAKPISVGSSVVDHASNPEPLCRSVFAPYWVCVDGVVVADYGDDEAAAERHYRPLSRARRVRMGWPLSAVRIEGGSTLVAEAQAS